MLAPVLVALSLAVASFAQTSHTYVFQDFEKGLGTWEVFGSLRSFRLKEAEVVPGAPSVAASFTPDQATTIGVRWTSGPIGHLGGPLMITADCLLEPTTRPAWISIVVGPSQRRSRIITTTGGRAHPYWISRSAQPGPFSVAIEVLSRSKALIDNIRVARPAPGAFTGFDLLTRDPSSPRLGRVFGEAFLLSSDPGFLALATSGRLLQRPIKFPVFSGLFRLDPSLLVVSGFVPGGIVIWSIPPGLKTHGVVLHSQVVHIVPSRNLAYIGPLTTQVGG